MDELKGKITPSCSSHEFSDWVNSTIIICPALAHEPKRGKYKVQNLLIDKWRIKRYNAFPLRQNKESEENKLWRN